MFTDVEAFHLPIQGELVDLPPNGQLVCVGLVYDFREAMCAAGVGLSENVMSAENVPLRHGIGLGYGYVSISPHSH